MSFTHYTHSGKVRTRAEMEAEHGPIPPAITQHFTWRICLAHADVTYMTDDGGEHWIRRNVIHAAERARRDDEALEQQRIQRELK